MLKVIPFNGLYLAGDAPGNLPQTLLGAFLNFWVALGTWIWRGLVALANLFLAFIGFLVAVGMKILGAIAAAAIAFIEAAVKAAVLVFYYITFALFILTLTILILITGAAMAIFTALAGGSLIFSLNQVRYVGKNLTFEMTYTLESYHSAILDLDAIGIRFWIKFFDMSLFDMSWKIDPPFFFLNPASQSQTSQVRDMYLDHMRYNGFQQNPPITRQASPTQTGPSMLPLGTLPWDAKCVGGTDAKGHADVNGDGIPDFTVSTDTPDGVPDKYQDFTTAFELENPWCLFNPYPKNAAGGDTDGDNLPDVEESTYQCSKYAPDSDFDGLSDKWEVDHTSEYGCDPASPDLFVELRWTPDCEPSIYWDMGDFFDAGLFKGVLIGVSVGFFMYAYFASGVLDKILAIAAGVAMGLFAYGFGPVTTIDQTRQYFADNGINLHFIEGGQVPYPLSTSPFIDEWGYANNPNYRTNPYAIYCVFGPLDAPVGGITDIQLSGRDPTVLATVYTWRGFKVGSWGESLLSGADAFFGHELFHSITLWEDSDAWPVGHYMYYYWPPLIPPTFSIRTSDWEDVNLIYKVSTPIIWPI